MSKSALVCGIAAAFLAGWALAASEQGADRITNGDFEAGLRGWYSWCKAPSTAAVSPGQGVDGSAAVMLRGGGDPSRPASLATRRIPLDGKQTFRLSFLARADGNPTSLSLRFAPKTARDELIAKKMAWHTWRLGTGPWQKCEYTFVTPPEVGKAGLCHFTFFCKKGRVLLDNVRLTPYEGQGVLEYGGNSIPPGRPDPRAWIPLPGRGDILFFERPEPGDFRSFRADAPPLEGELVERVGTFCARGAPARVWFGVVGQKDLAAPLLTISPLRTTKGQVFPAGAVHVFRVLSWPRRVSSRTLSYRVASELLEPMPLRGGRCAIPATRYDTAKWDWVNRGETRFAAGRPEQFMVAFDGVQGVVPGVYRGEIVLAARGVKSATLPVTVTVLRCAIAEPDPAEHHWSIDGDTYRYAEWDTERIRRELAVLRAAGIHGLKCKGLWKQEKRDGQWTGVEVPGFLNVLRAMKDVGMAGPVFLSNQRLPRNVGQWLGKRFDPRDTKTWTPEFEDTLKRALGMADTMIRGQGIEWFLYPADEIYGTDRALPSANILKLIHRIAPQIPICVTCDIAFTNRAVPGCIHRRMYNPRFCVYTAAIHQQALDEAKRLGQPFEWYGSGSYGSQMANVSANRYVAGVLFWKSGAVGHHSWTLQRPSGSAWNDFGGRGNRMVLYPPKFGDAPFTQSLQWIGLRDGILDGWYFHTLERALARAGRSDNAAVRALAASIRDEYRKKLNSVPWYQDSWLAEITSGRLESLRWWVASATQQIEDALAGRPAPPAAARQPLRPEALRLVFYPQEPQSDSPAFDGLNHPFVRIAKLGAAPVVDGRLDAACQGKASVLRPMDPRGRAKPATRFFVGHTEDHLWVFAVCEEPSMATLKERLPKGKGKVWRDDSVEFFLDSNFDQRTYYQFIANSAGNALVYHVRANPAGKTTSEEVSAQGWRFAVHKEAKRWCLELLVPLSVVKARPGLWGIGLVRNRWASGREQHFFYPQRVWLFHRPGSLAPATFQGGKGTLAGLDLPGYSLGTNAFSMTFAGWTGSHARPTLRTTGGAQADIEKWEVAGGRATCRVRYDLPRPGAYEIGIVTPGTAPAASRHYAIHPVVERVLDPPDAFLRMYRTTEASIRFPFGLCVRPEALAGFRVRVQLGGPDRGKIDLVKRPETARFDVLLRPDLLAAGRYRLGLEVLRPGEPKPILSTSVPLEVLPGYK